LNLSFFIQPDNIDTINADLFLQINELGLSYTILDNGHCAALVMYDYGEGTSVETSTANIHQVIASQPCLQQKFNGVHIVYGYAPSVLVPGELKDSTDYNAILELVYGDANESVTREDFMKRQGIYNVYGIPSLIEMVLTRYFTSATHHHMFSLLADLITETGNHLYCVFETGQLKVMLLKEQSLQLMQRFSYKTSVDVLYHLLNLCKAYKVNVDDVLVHLSGKIDEHSPLYAELHQYFLRLTFEQLPPQFQYPDEVKEQPAHYFSHLFATAACV
jgi:hypothetical protein